MTATRVGHHQVIADEPTASPHLRDHSGQPVVWKQVRTLLLDNDTVVYGCIHCDYTNPNLNSIRPHLGVHNRRTATNGTISTDLKHLLHKLEQIDKLTRERDEWRSRARVAESALATLRRALRP